MSPISRFDQKLPSTSKRESRISAVKASPKSRAHKKEKKEKSSRRERSKRRKETSTSDTGPKPEAEPESEPERKRKKKSSKEDGGRVSKPVPQPELGTKPKSKPERKRKKKSWKGDSGLASKLVPEPESESEVKSKARSVADSKVESVNVEEEEEQVEEDDEVPATTTVDDEGDCYAGLGRPRTAGSTYAVEDEVTVDDVEETEGNEKLIGKAQPTIDYANLPPGVDTSTRDTAQTLEQKESDVDTSTRDTAQTLEQKGSGVDQSATRDTAEELEEARSRSVTRDTAEGLEKKRNLSDGSVTRDTAETLMRKDTLPDNNECDAAEKERAFEAAAIECPIICQRKADEEVCDQPPPDFFCPGTPGDDSGFAVQDRPESPYLATDLTMFPVDELGHKIPLRADDGTLIQPPIICKHHYKPKKYISMWGSEESFRRWTLNKLESRMKRKHFERMHAKNSWLRERMRMHARDLRRRLRCKDQSKIPSVPMEVSINKAYYFRFNYNREVPCMPADVDRHLDKFKKPPFKRYQKGRKVCFKYIDEFDKLRVCKEIPRLYNQ